MKASPLDGSSSLMETYFFFQFANAVAGTGLENWQVKEGSLGFSRGNKGFFAMGDLNNVEFYTGLPDGEYCDIIHDCKQTIRVQGGSARFNKAESNDPVAAICVGCWIRKLYIH